MIKTDTTMDLNYFNDFYLVESIKAEINSAISLNPQLEFSHSVMKLQDDIQEFCDTVYPNMAMRTFVYLYAACAGEARHSRSTAAETWFFPETLNCGRSEVFQLMTEFAPTPENIQALIDIFEQKWVGSFGGKMWWQISKALKMYFEVTPVTFLDHVIDLQHNNGTVFSKTESTYLNFKIAYDGSFSHFLDMKFRHNILKRGISQTLKITRKVHRLIERWLVIFREKTSAFFSPTLRNLSDYHIEWGSRSFTRVEKWAAWADCSEGNVPNLKWLTDKLARGKHLHKLTRKNCKKALNIIKKRGINKLSVFGTAYNKRWAKQVHHYYRRMKEYLPAEKCKVTYFQIPVKMKQFKEDWKLLTEFQVAIPYYGYGEKTDYGFKFISTLTYTILPDTTGFDGGDGYTNGYCIKQDAFVKIITENGQIYHKDKKLEAALA